MTTTTDLDDTGNVIKRMTALAGGTFLAVGAAYEAGVAVGSAIDAGLFDRGRRIVLRALLARQGG